MNPIRLKKGLVSIAVWTMFQSVFSLAEARAQLICDPSDPSCSTSRDPSSPSDPSDPSEPTSCDPSQPNCTINDAAIKASATKEARKVANRIAGTFGKRENHNFNFSTAFKEEYLRDLPSPNYDQGYRAGRVAGASFGEAYGRQAVRSEADQLAQSDAANRFRSVLDLDVMPDVRVKVPLVRFDGIDQAPVDNGFNSAFKKISEDLDYRLDPISWSQDGFALRASERGTLKLREVYSDGKPGEYAFSDAVFDSESGFSSWQQGDYGGGYDTKLYRALTSEQQKLLFRQTFQRTFEGVILDKYYFVRKRLNRFARDLGQEFGEVVRLEHDRATGYTEGYRRAAKETSARVYASEFSALYERAFEVAVQYYNQNAVIETSEFSVATNDRFGFVPGSIVSLSLQKVANLGRVMFDSNLEFESADLDFVSQPIRFKVQPLATKSPALSLERVGQVSSRTRANTTARLIVKLGSQSFSIDLPLKWSSVIADFSSRSRSDPRYNILSAYVIEQLRSEFLAALRDNSNVYSRQSLLGDLVNHYSRLSTMDRTNVKSISLAISKISKEGGGFHPFIRAAFNSLAAKLK